MESKFKKSLIPKRELKIRGVEKYSDNSVLSPEVKNTMKDIIRLLKGLDNISGGPESSASSDTKMGKSKSQNAIESGQNTASADSAQPLPILITTERPVRVSNIILKHEDPKYTKVTFERFNEPTLEPSTLLYTTNSQISSNLNPKKAQEQDEAKVLEFNSLENKIYFHNPQNVNAIQANNKRRQETKVKAKPTIKTHRIGPPSKGKFVKFENAPAEKTILPTKRYNRDNKKPVNLKQLGLKHANNTRDSYYVDKEIAGIAKLYKENLVSDDEDEKSSKEEGKFYAYKQNTIFKEPSLSIFLPTANQLDNGGNVKADGYWASRTSVRHETSLPENFGAPYFRLDGALLEHAYVPSVSPSVNIHKVVRTAVQEQQLMYQTATEEARHLKKKLVKTANNIVKLQAKPKQ